MDESRISGGYLKTILRGERFKHTYEEERRKKKQLDDAAFALYCKEADQEEVRMQEMEAEGLIGRRRRQKRDRHHDPRGKLADGHEGHCHVHGKPDIVSGRRPGVKLENNKSYNLRVRGRARAELMRTFKYGFVISYLYEYRDSMRDCFTIMDKDGSGELNRMEFCDGLHETLGILLSKTELVALFDIVDVDKSDHIEWHEVQAVLRQAPKVVFVGLEEFYESLYYMGYKLNEYEGETLYAKVCLNVDKNHAFDEDAQTKKVELRRIRYCDLHKLLKHIRSANMRSQLISTLPKVNLFALDEAEKSSGQVWRIERTAVSVYRMLRDLNTDLQKDALLNFAEACNLDETINSELIFNPKKIVSVYQKEMFDSMMRDSIAKMEAYAVHLKLEGPDAPPPVVEKPLTLTERSGLECARGYVRALMNAKLTRVRDIFRAMDDDGRCVVDLSLSLSLSLSPYSHYFFPSSFLFLPFNSKKTVVL